MSQEPKEEGEVSRFSICSYVIPGSIASEGESRAEVEKAWILW